MQLRATLSILLLVLVHVVTPAVSAAPPSTSDIAQVSNVVSQIGYLESQSNWDAVYDLIHPFSAMAVPRDAVVNWYENQVKGKKQTNTSIESVTFLDHWRYPAFPSAYLENVAEVFIRQDFEDEPSTYTVMRLANYQGLGWRWFIGDDRESIAQMINTYSNDYAYENYLIGKHLDQSWSSSDSSVYIRYQAPWTVEANSQSPSIEVSRFEAGQDSFYTAIISLQTTSLRGCLQLYNLECGRIFNDSLQATESSFFSELHGVTVVQGFAQGNHLIPRVLSAQDDNGQDWFVQIVPLHVSDTMMIVRADLHVGETWYDVSPIDAVYLWGTLAVTVARP